MKDHEPRMLSLRKLLSIPRDGDKSIKFALNLASKGGKSVSIYQISFFFFVYTCMLDTVWLTTAPWTVLYVRRKWRISCTICGVTLYLGSNVCVYRPRWQYNLQSNTEICQTMRKFKPLLRKQRQKLTVKIKINTKKFKCAKNQNIFRF